MKQKHWQVSVFDQTSEAVKNDTFYTTDTEVYLVFELVDEDFTPDSATVTVYNTHGKVTIHVTRLEVVDGIVRYEMPVEAIRYSGDWRTQVVFTKDNEDYTTEVVKFDVGGHLLGNKKPPLVLIENWNSFMKHARDLIDDWQQLEKIRQTNEQQRELAESARQNEFEANEIERESAFEERYGQLEEEYAPKLTEITTQLAQKVEKGEPNSLSWGMTDQYFKENVSGGQVAVVGRDSVGVENLIDGSVTERKTTFFDTNKENLFDGSYIIGKQIRGSEPNEGVIIESLEPHMGLVYLEIKPDTLYTISKSDDTTFLRVAEYSEDALANDNIEPTVFDTGGDYNTYRFKSSGTSRFLAIQPMRLTDYKVPTDLVVVEGYNYKINNSVKPKLINEKSLNVIIEEEENLFNGEYIPGLQIRGNVGYEGVIIESLEPHMELVYLKVNPHTTYSIKKSDDTSFMRVATYSEDKPILEQNSVVQYFNNIRENSFTFTTNENEHFVAIQPLQLSDDGVPDWLIVTDSINPPTKPYTLRTDKIEVQSQIEEINYIINGDLTAEYQPYTAAPQIDETLTATKTYDYFDDLMDAFPNYISKELLVTEPTGIPVYRYDFIPPSVRGLSIDEKMPKVLYVSGIHGSEKESISAGIRFFSDLCNHWEENETLKTLRGNVHFIVIPAFNAYGVEKNSYENSNGVNLNRNFLEGFVADEAVNTGDTPLSEVETQGLYQLLETESDIIFGIDNHRFNPFQQGNYTMWAGNQNEKMNKYIAGWAREMNSDFISMHPELTQDGTSYVRIPQDYIAGRTGGLAMEFIARGYSGTMLEFSRDPNLNDFHTHALGELIAYAVKDLHNNPAKWTIDGKNLYSGDAGGI